jgi:sulfane dehydrogenase subunit SoxC
LAEGSDAAHLARSIPLAKALDDAIIAFGQNGEAVRPQQGYPVRLVLPGYEGNMWVKWLRRIEIGDRPWFTRWETRTYTDLMPDGLARQFTFVNEVNSVITAPCPEKPLRGRPGFVEISGLAWSGAGRITRVDVSVDGGDNWRTAALQDPVLPKALTRFRIPGNGRKARSPICKAAPWMKPGACNPALPRSAKRAAWRAFIAENSIHTWLVDRDGTVVNVQIDA